MRGRIAQKRALLRLAATALVLTLLTSGLAWLSAPPAAAASFTLLVNSLSHQGDDVAPGNGSCLTATGVCTLRAALQESNALGAADDVVIAPAADVDSATPGVQSSGIIVGQGSGAANWMFTGALTPWGDGGALFMATRRVTLDFQNRLGIRSLNDGDPVTAIYLNGPDVAIRNFSNIRSNETAFVVGGAGDRAVIENGSSIDPGSIDLERVLWLANGADGVTVRNVEMGSTYAGGGSAIRIANLATINDLTIDRIRMYDPDTEGYHGIAMEGTATLNRLRITGSTFEGFQAGFYPMYLVGASVTDGVISGNTFRRINGGGIATVWITRPGTNNVVSGNTFANTATDVSFYGVYFSGLGLAATANSGWVVQDNYFDGRRSWSVFVGAGSGILPVRRNTFGPASFGGGTAANETDTTALVFNEGTLSNQKINTWIPTAVGYDTTACTLAVSVTPPTVAPIPATPVRVDVYYTPTTKAEIYLGGRDGLTAAGTVTVPYTLGAGNIRVQTTAASGATSQYSRVLAQPLADACAPRATVDQAVTQADPTSVRAIAFTVQFSEAIAENLLTTAFAITGSTAPGARVTGVTRTSDSAFAVTAQADGSGTVVLTLPAGAVRDAAGNSSLAATSTDNSVTYSSPLAIAPTSVSVTEGGPAQTYTVSRSLAATAPITIGPAVGDPAWAAATPTPLSIDTIATTGQISVAAVDDAVVNGTRNTTITHVVSSTDPNFDGLLVGPVGVTVLDNDEPVAANSTLTLSGGPRIADGTDSFTATATIRNAANAPLGGMLVTYQVDSGAHLSGTSCTTAANGTCAVQLTSTDPGTYAVRALVSGVQIGGSPAPAQFVTGPADPATSTISSSALTLPANGVSNATITVRLKDASGHDITTGGATVTLQSTAGSMTAVTDNGDGTYTATLTAGTVVGTAVVSYRLGGTAGASTVTINFVAGAASASTATIVAVPTTIVADGASTSTITVTLLDGYGNAVVEGGDDVDVFATAGTLGPVIDNLNGTYTATLTSTSTAETAALTFTVNGAPATATETVAFVAGPVDPGSSTIAASPASIIADGVSQSAVTVTLRDTHGNVVPAGSSVVGLSASNGTLSGVTGNGDGTFTALLTAPTTPGTAVVSFTVDGTAGGGTAQVRFLAGAPDPEASLIAANPTVIIADGASTSTVTVTVRDAQGTVLTEGGADVEIGTDLGTITGVIDNLDGTYTATLTSTTTTGTATLSFTVNGVASSTTAAAQFVAGPADVTKSQIAADPTTQPADGTSASTVTITLRDAHGNPLTSGGATVTVATMIGALGAVTDNGDGTYTAYLSSTASGTAIVSFTVDGTAGPATATVAFTAGTPDPGTSTIAADPTSVTADGLAASTVTVTVLDANGNPTTGGVTMATTLGGLSGVTDNGDGTHAATLTSSEAGTATVSFTVDGVAASATTTVAFVPGAADPGTSEIAAVPPSITADSTSTSTVTVQLKDTNGNNLTSSGGTVLIATSAGTLGPVINHANGSYTATLTSATTAATASLTFTVGGVSATDTATVTFTPGAADPATSQITASPNSITADGTSTSTVTVQLKDTNGNDLTVGGDTIVIATDTGTVGATTDNLNGTYTATLTSATLTGTATLTFTVGGTTATDTATVAFTPGAADPATSQITANPTSITADGTSTSTVTVQLRDVNGNNLLTSGGTFAIATDTGTVGATTDNLNGTYTATLTSATTTGTATLTFTVNGTTATDTATVAFTPGTADPGTSQITANPTSIVANGASTSTITVQLKDSNGNNLLTSGGTVAITTTAGTITSTTDHGNGAYTATLTSATTTGTATLTFTVNGAPGTESATVQFTPGAADPATSQITASPNSITADGTSTSTVTVQLKDTNGNDLTAGGDTIVIATDAGTVGSTTDNLNGTYTATLTSATTTGTATLTFTVNGTTATDTATVTFTPGTADPGTSEITADPTSIVANGASTSTITVQLKDTNGNNLLASGGTVAIATDAGTVGATTDNHNGTYTATLTSAITTGTATLTFTINGAPGTESATVQFTPGAAHPGTSVITAVPASITADGTSTSTVTVQLKDTNGNNLTNGGTTVTLSATAGTLSSVTDNADGTYTATLTSTTRAGASTVGFAVDGTPADATATVTFVAGIPDPATSEITSEPMMLTADGISTSTVTVRLRDAAGNDVTVGGAAVIVSTDAGAISGTNDNGNGTYTAVLTSSTAVGTATLTFTVGGAIATDAATVQFVPGPASPDTSEITAEPESITADGASTSTVTVRLRDAKGNDLGSSGGTVVIGASTGTISATTDNVDGTYTATLTAPTALGSATLTFTVNSVAAADSAQVQFFAGAADAATSIISASALQLVADGAATSTIAVQVRDPSGNNLTAGGATVTMGTTAGTLSAVTDNGDGTYTATLTAPTSAAAATVSFTLGGAPGTSTVVVTFTAGEPSPAQSVITAEPVSIIADGGSTSTVTVRLKDPFGNDITSGGADVVISANAGSVGPTSDNGDGTYTATLTSGTIVGTATLTFTIAGAAATDTAEITFVAGPADPLTSTITATPGSIRADGVSTSAVTVRLVDAVGNDIVTGGATVVITTNAGSITDVTDNGNGTYTATLTSATTIEVAALAFTVNGGAGGAGGANVEFIAGPADPGVSDIDASPASGVEADGVQTSLVTVTLRDAIGHQLPAGGDQVALTTTLGSLTGVVDNNDGTYTAILTSSSPGPAIVRFTFNGLDGTATATVGFVDTTAPAPPTITGPTGGGALRPDAPVSGTGEPGATVTVTDSGGAEVCSATVDTAGEWTCFPATPLPEGQATLTATQTDPGGNESPPSTAVTVTVDGTPPNPPVPGPTDGSSITGVAEPGSTITIRDPGGTVVCTAVTATDGTFACTPSRPLPDGALLSVTTTDPAGNESAPSHVRVGGPSIELRFDVVEQGAQNLLATGRGFLPGEAVDGLLESSPVDLGTLTADASGVVTFEIDLPADISVGSHTVTLTGALSGSVADGFQVVAPNQPAPSPAAEPPSTPVPTPAPVPSAGPTQGPAPTTAPLPNTGSPVSALVQVGLLLLVAGAGLVQLSRRRRSGFHD